MEFRIATRSDADRLAPLIEGFRDHLGASNPTRRQLDAFLPRVLIDRSTEFVLAMTDAGTAIGYSQTRYYLSVWTSAAEAHLEDLYIVPKRRGSGAGRALLSFAVQRAQERGAAKIGLHTNENNEAGQALYRSFDFQPQTETAWDGGREVYWRRALDGGLSA